MHILVLLCLVLTKHARHHHMTKEPSIFSGSLFLTDMNRETETWRKYHFFHPPPSSLLTFFLLCLTSTHLVLIILLLWKGFSAEPFLHLFLFYFYATQQDKASIVCGFAHWFGLRACRSTSCVLQHAGLVTCCALSLQQILFNSHLKCHRVH